MNDAISWRGEVSRLKISARMSKMLKASPETAQRFAQVFKPELVSRTCALTPVKKLKVKSLVSRGPFIAFASPESTFAVTKKFIDGAQKSILIGIYDFTAGYMKELLLQAMQRGVKVSLMLDLDNRSGETPLFQDLVKHGCEGVPAPSCASAHAHYFPSSHEKVIVIDGLWSLVQSGNYSNASIPLNEKDGGDAAHFVYGNRDMGLAVKSKKLATFFSKILRTDMKLELDATAPPRAGMAGLVPLAAFGAKPTAPAPTLFASKIFQPAKAVAMTPILSPDNYMEVIPGFLESATRSIEIEQQYIRTRQPLIRELLGVIQRRMQARPQMAVRIILARPGSASEVDDIRMLSEFGLKIGTHLRLLSPKHFVHCHNKMINVDRTAVLISSQNWSDFAVSKNREAGLLLKYPEVAKYFADIFQVDWDTGLQTVAVSAPEIFAPSALATGKVVPLNWGDYAPV